MSRNPLYKQRPIEPNPATYGGQRINDFIVLSEAFSNCYLIETSEGNIQINTGMGMEAPVVKANFDDHSMAPLKYVIFTQGHVDHLGGTAFLRDQNPGVQVIAQANNTEHQAYDTRLAKFRGDRSAFAFVDKFAKAFADYAAHDYTQFPAQDAPTPDILFESKHSLELGGLQVELIAVPGAETNDSLIVWLPQHKICFTGNLFGCPFGHFPNLVTVRGDRYRDALTVAAAVNTVRALGAETILYGHHGPVEGKALIEEELTALHGAILHVHDAVVDGMNAGKDLPELMSEITLPPEMEVGQGYGKVSWSVRAIWENYAGWFKHSSTTELYAEPANTVHQDLLELAGGARPLVVRAQEKLDNQQAVEALHLLDIVLSVEPDHGDAKKVAITAHELLLDDSVNFWLSSWLKQQIKLLQG